MFCQCTILDSVIIHISLIQNELEVKDTTDTQKSASYFDLPLEINNVGRIKTKLYHKRDDFIFPIVYSLFISRNISVALVYGVHISQLIRYSGACAQHSDFLDIAQLLTKTLLKQAYVVPMLVSFPKL